MRRLGPLLALFSLVLAACGQNPLLSTVSSNFSPVKVGSQWSYASPDGSTQQSREVVSTGVYQGREAFALQTQTNALPASVAYWSLDGGALESYNASLGWTLQRRLPYVTGNKWDVATGVSSSTAVRSVEGFDSVTTPGGNFENCFKLKTKVSGYDVASDVTTVTETLLWVAPNVGDVRFACVDSIGTVTVTMELTSYRIPR